MITGGNAKVHKLETACPVKVEHKRAYQDDLGKYTLPVYPIDRETFYGLLRNKAHLIPKGLSTNTNAEISKDSENIWKGLPIDGKNYYVTLDKQGNICFPGQQSWSANAATSAAEEAEAVKKSDVQTVLDAAERLVKKLQDPTDKTRVRELIRKLNEMVDKKKGLSARVPAKTQVMLTDLRNAFVARKSKGANKTAGCAPILGEKINFIDEDRLRGDSTKTMLGADPSKATVNIPVTKKEISIGQYGYGRWPYRTGDGVNSVVCRPEGDPDLHKQNPFLGALFRSTRKRVQKPENVTRGAVEYEDEDISKHAAEAFACVNADEDACVDDEHHDIKVPYGKDGQKKP